MLTPQSGLPALFVELLLFLLLVNTLVSSPDRARVLRSLVVVLGSAFVLKFVILAGISDPEASRASRVWRAVFDAATLGTISQDPLPPAAGYAAFTLLLLLFIGLAALPRRRLNQLTVPTGPYDIAPRS
jgi:hypothetical protein